MILISSISTSKVITIEKSSSLNQAVNLMKKNHIGSLVEVNVFEGKTYPAGIITDRDIAFSIIKNSNPGELRVVECMHPSSPITISEYQGIHEAIMRMHKYGIKKLPVVSGDGTLVGLVSKDDILYFISGEITQIAQLHQASLNMNTDRFLLNFDSLNKNSFFNRKLPHRAVGVVYDPKHESKGNYVPTQIAKRYDGLIFIGQTTALESLPATYVHEKFPETWPSGQ